MTDATSEVGDKPATASTTPTEFAPDDEAGTCLNTIQKLQETWCHTGASEPIARRQALHTRLDGVHPRTEHGHHLRLALPDLLEEARLALDCLREESYDCRHISPVTGWGVACHGVVLLVNKVSTWW